MIAMKLMQVYSDRAGSELAARSSARLREDLGAKNCGETAWNTELLRSAKLRMIAAREAADADFVIIALQEGTRLTPELRQWLQLWKNRKRSKPATLVALLRRERRETPRTAERALHAFARSARMNFFCHSRVDLKQARYFLEPELSFLD